MDNAVLRSNEWTEPVGGKNIRYHVRHVRSVEMCGGDKERVEDVQ